MSELSEAAWRDLLRLGAEEVPDLVVVEGSWWRREREAQRLALLEDVRELGAPDWWWGRRGGHAVVYACLYGAPRAVEPVHVLGTLGTPVAVQIGSCGGLQDHVLTGDLVLPSRVTVAEGASPAYGGGTVAEATPALVHALAAAAGERGHTVHTGPHVTTEVLLRQPIELVRAWSRLGHLAVDMETSAVFSAAAWAGMERAAVLHVWDELLAGRSWLDPLPPELALRRQDAEADLFGLVLDTLLG